MNEIAGDLHGSRTLLSILIPVYNGEKYLRHLLGMFTNAYRETPQHFAQVEIIVANNASEDATQRVAESFTQALPMLRPLSLTPHLPTAEENVFRSFAYCNGTYTWALGVDDIPNFSKFGRMLEILGSGGADFILFNFPSLTGHMEIKRTANFFMGSNSQPVNLIDLTQRFGYWYVVAGISGQIMRTALVKDYDFQNLISQAGKIYSHVTAYLECFATAKTLVVNTPLIFYKMNRHDLAHWRRAAEIMGVFDEFIWTLGYIRQLKYLETRRIIPADYLKFMLEQSDTSYFRPILVVAHKLGDQIRCMNETDDKRNHLTRAEFDELYDYLLAKEPFLREYLWKLKDIHETILERKTVEESDWRELSSLHAVFHDFMLSSLLQSVVKDYEIYRIGVFYYAVQRDNRDALIGRLGFLFDEELPPDVFAGASEHEVTLKIESYDPGSESAHRSNVDRTLLRISESAQQAMAVYQSQLSAVQNQLAAAQSRLSAAEHEIMQEKIRFDLLKHAVTQSTSWKVTRPLRGLSIVTRKILGGA